MTDDRRYHLTDCGSGRGTWLRVESAGSESWAEVRQAFVASGEPLRIGEHRCTVNSLLERRATPGHGAASAENGAIPSVSLPHGRVERDPVTGEIIRKRP